MFAKYTRHPVDGTRIRRADASYATRVTRPLKISGRYRVSSAGSDSPTGYMGTSDFPKLLKDIRPAALARWKAALAREGTPPGRPCRCGHTNIWHDFYHERDDGEWEVCWGGEGGGSSPSGGCGFKERCDVCECIEFTSTLSLVQ